MRKGNPDRFPTQCSFLPLSVLI